MLDDILPVQFVEGVNEHSIASETNHFLTRGQSGIAIKYKAKTTYCLKKLFIYLTHTEVPDGNAVEVSLCLDNNSSPSSIVISSGTFTSPSVVLGEWKEVNMKPAVIVSNDIYWLTFKLRGAIIGLPIATDGGDSDIRFETRSGWAVDDIFVPGKIMLQFYGRFLPPF